MTILRSADGFVWEEINEIDGAGNSSSIVNYEAIDKDPYLGTSYYRLKQTDFDGQFEYSEIRSVSINELENLQIFPNPSAEQIIIEGNKSELADIIIYNNLGQDVTSLTPKSIKNEWKVVMDLSKLISGIYYLKTKTTANKVYKQ